MMRRKDNSVKDTIGLAKGFVGVQVKDQQQLRDRNLVRGKHEAMQGFKQMGQYI